MARVFSRQLLPVFLIFLLLCGCGRQDTPPVHSAITFQDDLGRQITLERPPERVAALLGSFADIWTLAGGQLCAAAEDAWSDFGLELPQAVNIGGAHSPNLELVLAAEPELVLASASSASNLKMQQPLESAGIAVAYFDVDHFDDYLRMLKICTQITGRQELYTQNGLALQERIGQIKAELARQDLPEAEKTVLLLRVHSGSVKAKGSQGTVLGEMLLDLGCVNIADSDQSLLENLSVESVIRQAPYRIFVVTMGDDTQKALENLQSLLTDNPAWGTLEAVTEGRLHIMDRKLFNMKPNAGWANSYEQLYKILIG